MHTGQSSLHPFVRLSREDWARLPADASFTLSEDDVREIEAYISPEEATQVYLPLSRLLYLHVDATRSLYRAARAFLAEEEKEVPYVVGIAGSVAAGKSTVARVLRALVSLWPGSPEVGLVSTDGFLYPNRELQARGLMERKGFPESYDLPLLMRFLADIKSGRDGVSAPIHTPDLRHPPRQGPDRRASRCPCRGRPQHAGGRTTGALRRTQGLRLRLLRLLDLRGRAGEVHQRMVSGALLAPAGRGARG